MSDINRISVTKEAYILSRQFEAMEKAMVAAGENVDGYRAFATSYNAMLSRAQKIFKLDETFLDSISQLKAWPTEPDEGIVERFACIKAEVAILKAAVFSFFEFYSPKEEKEKIGFHP